MQGKYRAIELQQSTLYEAFVQHITPYTGNAFTTLMSFARQRGQ